MSNVIKAQLAGGPEVSLLLVRRCEGVADWSADYLLEQKRPKELRSGSVIMIEGETAVVTNIASEVERVEGPWRGFFPGRVNVTISVRRF